MIGHPAAMLAGRAPGIHSAESPDPDLLAMDAAEQGFYFARINLSNCTNKARLLQGFAHALAFPEWFGDNWDAFADCLADLDWLGAPGHVLLIEGDAAIARETPEAITICREILADAIVQRSAHGLPMWVFWHTTDAP